MSLISIFFLFMALIGLIDKFLGGKFNLARSFDDGMKLIPEFMIFLMSIYCLGPVIIQQNQDAILSATSGWFFDPSILPGSLLATDMGAYPIAKALAGDETIGLYAGICIGGSLGTLVSFCLPIYISGSDREDGKCLTKGFIYGIIVLPVTLIISGLLFHIPAGQLLQNISMVLLLCLLVLIGLLTAPDLTSRFLILLGSAVKLAAYVSFVVIMAGLFFPDHAYLDEQIAKDGIVMIAKMSISVAGALVTMNLILRIFKEPLKKLGALLGINEYSIMGFLIGIPAGIAMLPLLPKMDKKGKILNGAFAVSCHYAFGAQMALVASTEPEYLMTFFFVKFTGGILAVLLALKMERGPKEE